jgi:hypothetical protein
MKEKRKFLSYALQLIMFCTLGNAQPGFAQAAYKIYTDRITNQNKGTYLSGKINSKGKMIKVVGCRGGRVRS